MAAEHPADEEADPHDEPDADLLDASMLAIEDYLEMYRAVGNRARYEILRRLVYAGETRAPLLAEEVGDEIDIDDSTFYYHLGELVDVGLVAKRAHEPST